ncbi:hypothetical protein RND81_02G159700 [Saponaria officinalis]|uniref:Uncharacterized protein n=1 Tax=Saponaria officinalis TaxID=3572 RepID=A0AAW1MMI2_SAPOF
MSSFSFHCSEQYYIITVLFNDLVAQLESRDGKRKCETLWPIFKFSHQKSHYIYDLYYRRNEISKELYEFCLDQGYVDIILIAKWKKIHMLHQGCT